MLLYALLIISVVCVITTLYSLHTNEEHLLPNYARERAIRMHCNQYKFESYVDGKSSGHLLYKTLEICAKTKNVLTAVQDVYNKWHITPDKMMIWGFKKTGDTYRWEIYFYHFSQYDAHIIEKYDNFSKINMTPISKPVLDVLNKNDTIVHSIDIENTDAVYNDEIHTYDVVKTRDLPFYGMGYDLKSDGVKKPTGMFIYASTSDILNNYVRYLRELDLPNTPGILKILLKYRTEYIFLMNKHGDLYVWLLKLNIESFISFLEEFKYKEELVLYIKNNIESYRNISHEISIVYDSITLIPKRSSFYGCI